MDTAISDVVERMARQMDRAVFGDTHTEAVPMNRPTLTFEKLKALHDYLKPERLTRGGEELEIYGYNVHKKFTPPGITVLSEKDDPNAVKPKRGKLVIIDENIGKALVFDPSKDHGGDCTVFVDLRDREGA